MCICSEKFPLFFGVPNYEELTFSSVTSSPLRTSSHAPIRKPIFDSALGRVSLFDFRKILIFEILILTKTTWRPIRHVYISQLKCSGFFIEFSFEFYLALVRSAGWTLHEIINSDWLLCSAYRYATLLFSQFFLCSFSARMYFIFSF